MSGRRLVWQWRDLPLLLVVLAVGGWACWQGQRLLRADLLSQGARWSVTQWASTGKAPASQADFDRAEAALTAALAITPDDPSLHELLGDLAGVAGRRDWADEAARPRHYAAAVAHYQRALALRPRDPQTWASLATAYQGLGDTGPLLHQAWAQALKLGPNEGAVQPMLLETALATWATATPAMQDWVTAFFLQSAEPQRKAINELARRYGLRFDADPATAQAAPKASGGG